MITIVLTVLGVWLLVSVLLALVIGRAIKLADRDHGRKVAYRGTPVAAVAPRVAPRVHARAS
jgi:uncharacterized membrane protein